MTYQGRIQVKWIEELTDLSWALLALAYIGGLLCILSFTYNWFSTKSDFKLSLIGGLLTISSCIAFVKSLKSTRYPILYPQRQTLNTRSNVADYAQNTNNSLEEPQKLDKSEVKPLEGSDVNAEKDLLKSKKPRREELEELKKALGHQKGSFQYKKYGDGVYIVTYNSDMKKNDWSYLGKWAILQQLINGENIS